MSAVALIVFRSGSVEECIPHKHVRGRVYACAHVSNPACFLDGISFMARVSISFLHHQPARSHQLEYLRSLHFPSLFFSFSGLF